ncbi:thioredoxin [Vagococcus coleopterorum]|uniref:Thioredoxin n=1 Tax=Vagococcus coleopterorum TaxID=2714946 RepID=A0A6G8AKU5_9ENTE|nr:thioredoxin [Vagococcus coleopterorum]QIL45691.1 thioredoxin [Vagococcus coleopterorum]
MVKNLNDNNFNAETSEGLVLVDFWAPWCGPCRMQGPILDELAEEMTDVTIAKVNVDENQAAPALFGVQSIPTLIVKKDGEAVETLIGVHRKEQLIEILNKHK